MGFPSSVFLLSLLYFIITASVKLSIIIPALNEENYIGNLLSDLTTQDIDASDIEVIVVDSGSTDKTVEVVRDYDDQLNISVVNTSKGVAKARNAGADTAKGEWLLFLDSDVRLDSDFLTKSLQELASKKLDIASNVMYSQSRKLIDIIGTGLAERYMRLFSKSRQPMAGGYCIWIKRSLHKRLGGFDTKLVQAEDHEYLARARKQGGRFAYLKSKPIRVSLRRFEEHGRIRMLWRYFKSEIYRFSHGGRIEKDIINYEFGEHDK